MVRPPMRTDKCRLPGVALLAVALLLTGCTGAEEPAERGAAAPGTPTQAPAPVHGHSDEDEDLPPAEPYPTWDAAARAEAVATATTAMSAFARPALDEATWWAELAPLLSPAAATAYAGTDPANVPAQAVTGTATLTDDSSTYLAPVAVPTDVGAYLVLLSRQGQGSPWLVERFTPPETVNHS